jgi:hypothetical protein
MNTKEFKKAMADLERLYRQAAKKLLAENGKIVVDVNAKVNFPLDEDRRGAYVQAWVWVDDPTADGPEDETGEREEEQA